MAVGNIIHNITFVDHHIALSYLRQTCNTIRWIWTKMPKTFNWESQEHQVILVCLYYLWICIHLHYINKNQKAKLKKNGQTVKIVTRFVCEIFFNIISECMFILYWFIFSVNKYVVCCVCIQRTRSSIEVKRKRVNKHQRTESHLIAEICWLVSL